MSYVDIIRGSNDQYLQMADDAVTQAEQILPGIIRWGVQEWVDRQAFGLGSLVPNGWVDEAADVIIAGMRELCDYAHDVIAIYREANRYLGSPDTLRTVADALNTLAQKAEEVQLNKSQLQGWLSWDDPPMSRTYDVSIGEQEEPLGRIATTATSISDAIDQHANDIENYYLELAKVVGGACATILGIVGAALGLAGAIPTGGVSLAATIIGLITAVGGLITMVIGIVELATTLFQESAAKLDQLPDQITTWQVPGFAIVR